MPRRRQLDKPPDLDAAEVTIALGGRWAAGRGLARCPAHEDRSPSLSLADGDDGRLLLRCFAGCDFTAIRDALARLGLWPESDRADIRPPPPRRSPPPRPEPKPGDLEAALRLWASARPIEAGDVASIYLARRLCPLPPHDAGLRWIPELRHPRGGAYPALLALVTDAVTGAPMTLHRTFLAPDGAGKAPVDPPRLLWLGLPKAGGVVRLTPDDDVTDGLAIAEGLETALTAMAAGYPTWACVDAGNLGSFPVLPGIEALTIIADHDKAGLAAAEACATRWREAGREVRTWLAATPGADLNDLARASA